MPQEFEINIPTLSQEPVADITAEGWGNTLPPEGEFPEFDRTQEESRYRKFGGVVLTPRGIWE
jgi:hypothetical protein